MIGKKLRPVSQKMWQFHLNMNIEGTLWRHAVTSLVTSSLWKSFWWMIYILSFYTCCQIEAILKTANFLNWRKFEVQATFLILSVTGSLLYWPDSQGHSLHFELLIEVLAKKLRELWQFQNLVYFLTWWPSFVTYLIVQVTCRNQWPSTYMDPIWWIMHENALISFKHEYRRLTLSSRCDVISDVIIMKNFFHA